MVFVIFHLRQLTFHETRNSSDVLVNKNSDQNLLYLSLRLLANDPGDRGSTPVRAMPKT